MTRARRHLGFTLVETLVAVLILGFLLIGLAGGARYGMGAAIRQGTLSDARGELDAVDRTLRHIVAEADPRTPLIGTAGTLALVSSLPGTDAAESIGLGVDAHHRLVLRWTPRPAGRPLAAPPAAQETELLADVGAITLSYWSQDGAGMWQDRWSAQGLPALIRVRVSFTSPAGRRWPDIVMAPMRRRS